MSGARRVVAPIVAVVVAAVACVGGDAEVRDPVPTLFPETPSTDVANESTTSPPTVVVTTVPVAERLPALADDVDGAVRAGDGTARAVTGTDGEVWFVLGACGEPAVEPAATAELIGPQHVVLDPGAGGADRGVTRDGLVEAELNLDIAQRTASLLRAEGVAVALTRETDADLSSSARGALGAAVGAVAVVSIHHVGAEPGVAPVAEARPAVFHQAEAAQSRRLGGLIHEAVVDAFAPDAGPWAPVEAPGVKPLLNQRGEDYFVVLRERAGAAVRVEVAALGENEATLLATEEGRVAEARALADALIRFLVGDEQGTGFIEPEEAVRRAPTSNTPDGCGPR